MEKFIPEKKKLSDRIFRTVSWIGIGLSFVFLGVVAYWEIYPYKIADFITPFEIITPVVKRGERVRYIVDGCKYVDMAPSIIKFFIDGVVYETPKSVSVVPKGCGKTISDAYVPRAIPPGTYSIKTVAEYKVNPIRTIQITNYTKPFKVE